MDSTINEDKSTSLTSWRVKHAASTSVTFNFIKVDTKINFCRYNQLMMSTHYSWVVNLPTLNLFLYLNAFYIIYNNKLITYLIILLVV